MLPNRISAKLFVEDAASLNVAGFIPMFHSWIREARVPGVPIDVVNYSHVKDGPSLLLIGHAGDYILDFSGGRAGLRYLHKRDWPGDTLGDRLHTVLDGLLLGARLIVGAVREPPLQPSVKFNTGELELTFPDRLNTPNNVQTYEAIAADVRAVLASFYGVDAIYLLRSVEDERQALTIAVQTPASPSLATLHERLQAIAPLAEAA